MAFSRAVAEQHVIRLLRKHSLHARWLKGPKWAGQAQACESARLVFIPRPYNAHQYLTCLHEIGHIVGAVPWSSRSNYDFTISEFKMVNEAAAWAWAMEHIHEDLAPKIQRKTIDDAVGGGMASYADQVVGSLWPG